MELTTLEQAVINAIRGQQPTDDQLTPFDQMVKLVNELVGRIEALESDRSYMTSRMEEFESGLEDKLDSYEVERAIEYAFSNTDFSDYVDVEDAVNNAVGEIERNLETTIDALVNDTVREVVAELKFEVSVI